MAPLLSVVLATRNGAAVIGEALESLLRQSLPPEQSEIIVVNNGSTDRTAQMKQEIRKLLEGNYPAVSVKPEDMLYHPGGATEEAWRLILEFLSE